jgi:hypothetical protein
MYYGRGMILITYLDNTLSFGPDLLAIENLLLNSKTWDMASLMKKVMNPLRLPSCV